VAVVWRPRISRLPDLIIFQRARPVGRAVRYLFLSILKQLGSRPFSSKLAGTAHKTSVVRHGYHQMLAGPAFSCLRRSRRRSSKLGREIAHHSTTFSLGVECNRPGGCWRHCRHFSPGCRSGMFELEIRRFPRCIFLRPVCGAPS